MSIWSRLGGLFKRAPSSVGVSSGASVLPDLSLWQQVQRIGGSVTPADVSFIIRAADSGDMTRLIDLANEMRQKDGHLQSVLQTRETALCGLNWELVFPGQDPKSTRGKRQRRFVEKVLRTHPDFRKLIAHLTGSAYYGYAVAETVWAVQGGRQVPARFVCHGARRFGFRDKDGKLIWRDDGANYIGVDFLAKYPDKFIVSQPRINGDVPCREGLVRVLMWLALFRNWSLSDWLKLAELVYKPWRLGRYKKRGDNPASKEDVANLKAILSGMTSSGTAVHPDTVEVELKFPEVNGTAQGQGGAHASLFDTCGREMSKAVLGQTLTTEQGSVGSQALGNVHNQIRKDILESDAAHLAEVITRDVIEPMIRLNFGPTAPVPRFQFVTEGATDLVMLATALEKLAPIMRIPAEWARDKLGIPVPDEDDEILGSYDVDLEDLEDEAENDDEADDEPEDDDAADAA